MFSQIFLPATARSTKKRHRKQAAPVCGVPVLSRNRRTYLGFEAALTSPM
jgi:hypothetical protein